MVTKTVTISMKENEKYKAEGQAPRKPYSFEFVNNFPGVEFFRFVSSHPEYVSVMLFWVI